MPEYAVDWDGETPSSASRLNGWIVTKAAGDGRAQDHGIQTSCRDLRLDLGDGTTAPSGGRLCLVQRCRSPRPRAREAQRRERCQQTTITPTLHQAMLIDWPTIRQSGASGAFASFGLSQSTRL